MPKFTMVEKPKMPMWVEEACRCFQEPNHTLDVENGGPRWSTHPRPISPPSSTKVRPHERPSVREVARKCLGAEEDARVHPGAKEGGSCLHPALVGASPMLANGHGRWVGQGREEEMELS